MSDVDLIMESMPEEAQEPVCEDGDWNCMLEKIYPGYLLLVEAVLVKDDCGEGDENCIRVMGVDVTGLSNDDINEVIENFRVIYPDAKEVRVHFCGNHIGRPCKIMNV